MDEPLWTVQDTADYLKVPPATLYAWRSAGGKGPKGRRVGRYIRYVPSEVRDWVNRSLETA